MAVTESIAGGDFVRMTPQETADALERGEILLLDIREVDEFARERIPGAVLAPLSELRPDALPRGDVPIVLQCRSGARTRRLALALLAAGRKRTAHLEGGIIAWREAGFPVLVTDSAREITAPPRG